MSHVRNNSDCTRAKMCAQVQVFMSINFYVNAKYEFLWNIVTGYICNGNCIFPKNDKEIDSCAYCRWVWQPRLETNHFGYMKDS